MRQLLQDRPAWYVVGVTFGLVVAGVYAFLGEQVGILGGFSTFVERATGRRSTLGWKGWFVVGVVLGGILFGALGGGWGSDAYGWTTRTFDGGWSWVAGVILVGSGALIGFGAKTAGGCTSGNGLAGCSFGSRASIAATVTFFATAVGVSFVLRALGAS